MTTQRRGGFYPPLHDELADPTQLCSEANPYSVMPSREMASFEYAVLGIVRVCSNGPSSY